MVKIKYKSYIILYERPLYYIIIASLDMATQGFTGESASVTVANWRYCSNIKDIAVYTPYAYIMIKKSYNNNVRGVRLI